MSTIRVLALALALSVSSVAFAAPDAKASLDDTEMSDSLKSHGKSRGKARGHAHGHKGRTASHSRARSGRASSSRTVVVRGSSSSRSVPVRGTVSRSSSSRTVTVSHRVPSRQPVRVVRTVPARPAPPPSRPVVVYHRPIQSTRVVHIQQARPTHGVFVYGPRPVHHVHYASPQPAAAPVAVQQTHLPERDLDRARSLAVGLKVGMATGALRGDLGNNPWSDFSLGGMARYRPSEAFGLQVDLTHANQTWTADTQRQETSAALSAQAFAFPWAKISPFASAGMTLTGRNMSDQIPGIGEVEGEGLLFGPHGGLGVELGFDRFAIDLEARYVHYVNQGPDAVAAPGSLQTGVTVLTHF